VCAGSYGCVWGRGREWRPAAPVCCLPPHDRARSKSRVTARKQLRSQEGFILGRWNRKEIERSRSRRASLARPLSQHKQAQRAAPSPPPARLWSCWGRWSGDASATLPWAPNRPFCPSVADPLSTPLPARPDSSLRLGPFGRFAFPRHRGDVCFGLSGTPLRQGPVRAAKGLRLYPCH